MDNVKPYLTKANFKKMIKGENNGEVHIVDSWTLYKLMRELGLGHTGQDRTDEGNGYVSSIDNKSGMSITIYHDVYGETDGAHCRNINAPAMYIDGKRCDYITPETGKTSSDIGTITYERTYGGDCGGTSEVTHNDTENIRDFLDMISDKADEIESEWNDDAKYIVSGKVLNNSYIYDPNCEIVELDEYDVSSALKSLKTAGITFSD